MKQEIINRIQELGGTIMAAHDSGLQTLLQSITFNTVLLPKPEDTPWQTAAEAEPIYRIAAFLEQHKALFYSDKEAFYQKILDYYFRLTEKPFSQTFFRHQLFTPFRKGTEDYEEWYADFMDEEMTDLTEVRKVIVDTEPDFINIAYSYGFPDHYYVCLSDPQPDNPTVFGTDHEVFFSEISNQGSLEDFFNKFWTREELIAVVKARIEQ